MGRPVPARAGHLVHPGVEALVGDPQVDERLAGQEVALDVMHAVFDFALVAGLARGGGADQKAVVQPQAAIGLAQHRVVHQGLQHRRLEIVRHHPVGHAAEALEGAPMQANPGRRLLIEDELGVLVAAEAQGRHERPGWARAAAVRVVQWPDRAKVDLQLFARRAVDAHHRVRGDRAQAMHVAAHGRVAAGIAVVVAQALKDGGHFDALIDQVLDDRLIRLDGGRHVRRPRAAAQQDAQGRVIRQGLLGPQIAERLGQVPVLAHGGARQAHVAGDAAFALARPQPMDQIA